MRFAYVSVLFVVLLLGTAMAWAAPVTQWSVTLPDAGTYSYWVQAKTGTVSRMPTAVTHKGAFALPSSTAAGDTLYVLDGHTGQVAARPLTAPPGPLTLTVGEFKPVAAPAPVPAASAAPRASAPKPDESGPSGIARFFTYVLGLAIAIGVLWVLRWLVQTRGEPLLLIARRVGIEVPDPKPLDPQADAPPPVYEPPRPRAVENIPEEAGAAPPVRATPTRAFSGGGGGGPQLVGTQGLAAGSTVALTDGVVSIGRDGDNGIVLAEHTVSRRHARIEKSADGRVTLVDEGSANGVYVNGDRVQQAVLVPGDEIKIGDNFYRFEA